MYFSPPTSGGNPKSGYSFGVYQFDSGTNPSTRKFLSANVFQNDQSLLYSLEAHSASASQVATANQMLQTAMQNQSVQAAYNQLIQTQTQTMINTLQNIINNVAQTDPGMARQILSNQAFQLQIMDFINQYGSTMANHELIPLLLGQPITLASGGVFTLNPNLPPNSEMMLFYLKKKWALSHPKAAFNREKKLLGAISNLGPSGNGINSSTTTTHVNKCG